MSTTDSDSMDSGGPSQGQGPSRKTNYNKPIPQTQSNRKLCVNTSCPTRSDEVEYDHDDYSVAPKYAVTFYGRPQKNRRRNRKTYHICTDCLQRADQWLADSVSSFKEKKCIFNIQTPGYDVNGRPIGNDDDDDGSEGPEGRVVEEFDMEGIEDPNSVFQNVVSQLNLAAQAELCEEKLENDVSALEQDFKNMEQIVDQSAIEIENVRKVLELHCGPAFNRSVMRSVEITMDGRVIQLSESGAEDIEPSNLILVGDVDEIDDNFQLGNIDLRQNISDDEIQEIVPKKTKSTEKIEDSELEQLAPTPDILPRVAPSIGREVYVMRTNQLSYWVKGKILDVVPDPVRPGEMEYEVKIAGSKKAPGITKTVPATHLAYTLPTPFNLPVGSRVIAQFKDDFKSDDTGDNEYYVGIVAEKPLKLNNYRYLIFFDDGCAQYVDPKHVLWVCTYSTEIWQEVYPETQEFIRTYLLKYPERPMVRLTEGQLVTTEWNGSWSAARVVSVDCSLVRLCFEQDGRYEWVYRGCPRFLPLYQKDQRLREAALDRQSSSPSTSRPRARNSIKGKEPTIEYKYSPEDFGLTTAHHSHPSFNLDPFGVLEYEGKIVDCKVPDHILGPAKYTPHTCGFNCLRPTPPPTELRGINPLQIPFYLGFKREVVQKPKRDVQYVTPCGIRVRNYEELYSFLKSTQSDIGIDYFCFDYGVNTYHEFVPTRSYYTVNDSIAGNDEQQPIRITNALDTDFPESIKYSKDRIPGNGVTINTDPEFLSCCDCEDNCSDKTKCACWQLTVKGVEAVPGLPEQFQYQEIGYVNRRLMEAVPSGIYECNSRCKCKSETCLNRVVQHGLKCQLQLFKSKHKGWGIRSLHDIPIGSFICIYAGQILTEKDAEKKKGDDYFADLDYIEKVEASKEGYEEEAFGPGLEKENKSARKRKLTRKLFGKREEVYIMDAKVTGNVGRYFNHSCTPNVIVQSVFVDTHDIRFPWIAFFAFNHIKAGTELTWDYGYDIDSVPNKILYCHCGTPNCRGRLL